MHCALRIILQKAQKGENMNAICCYLDSLYSPRCNVDKDRYIAKVFVFDEFRTYMCLRDRHLNCPLFKKAKSGSIDSMSYSMHSEISSLQETMGLHTTQVSAVRPEKQLH